jgi:hypothetical protein
MIKLLIFDAGNILYKVPPNKIMSKIAKEFLRSRGANNIGKDAQIWKSLAKLARVGKLSGKGLKDACGEIILMLFLK